MSAHRERIRAVKTGKGKLANRGTGRYIKAFIYVPKEVATDSAFPFAWGEDVRVTIQGETILVEKWRPQP